MLDAVVVCYCKDVATEDTTASAPRIGSAHPPSFGSADVTTRSKAWKQFISNYSSANK